MNQTDITLIEQAAEKRFPYFNSDSGVFVCSQNNSRGDFLDGAMWTMEQHHMLFPRCFEALIKFHEQFEPDGSDADKELFQEVEDIFRVISEVKIGVKPRLHPTYPFTKYDETITELQAEVNRLRKENEELIDEQIRLEESLKTIQLKLQS